MRCSLAAVLVVYCLFTSGFEASSLDPPFKTLRECIAQAKYEIKATQASIEAETEALQKAHPGEMVGLTGGPSWSPGDMGWECYPSDGSPSTFGGYWEDPGKRWYNRPGSEVIKKLRRGRCNDYSAKLQAKPTPP